MNTTTALPLRELEGCPGLLRIGLHVVLRGSRDVKRCYELQSGPPLVPELTNTNSATLEATHVQGATLRGSEVKLSKKIFIKIFLLRFKT